MRRDKKNTERKYVQGTHGQPLREAQRRLEILVGQTYFPGDACERCGKRNALISLDVYVDDEYMDSLELCGMCSRGMHRKMELKTEERERTFKRQRSSGGRWNAAGCAFRSEKEMRELKGAGR